MKKLYYNFKTDELCKDDVNLFLEKGSKSSNCWWSNLNTFIGGEKSIIERTTNLVKDYMHGCNTLFETEESSVTAKLCPAIGRGILDKTFIVKAPCDFTITIDQDALFLRIKSNTLMSWGGHPPSQFRTEKRGKDGLYDGLFKDYMNIKFMLPIDLGTKNTPYMFLHPQYHNDNLPFTVLNGVIEGKQTPWKPLHINTMIKIPKKIETYYIKAGTPLAYLWFPEKLQLQYDKNLKEPFSTKFFGNIS